MRRRGWGRPHLTHLPAVVAAAAAVTVAVVVVAAAVVGVADVGAAVVGAAVVGAAIVRTAVTKIKSCSFCMAVTCFATKTCPTRFITAVLMVSTPVHSFKPSFVASQQTNMCKSTIIVYKHYKYILNHVMLY